jgi:hypothetical protein
MQQAVDSPATSSGQVGHRVRSQGSGIRDQPLRRIASVRQGGRSVKSTHFPDTPQNPLRITPKGARSFLEKKSLTETIYCAK